MRLLSLSLLLLVTTSSLAVEESVNYGQVRCGKVKLKCTMKVSFKCDCSEVIKVTPKCTGSKKAKCQKVPVSFVTENGCTLTGKFKASGKKYSMSNLGIKPPVTTPTPTDPVTTTTTEATTPITTAEPLWSSWGDWSTCDLSSLQTMKFRHRNCINAATAAACDGEPVETAPCTEKPPSKPACPNTTSSGAL